MPYVEHFRPDVAAAYIWLKNRRPHQWREKSEVNVNKTSEERKVYFFEMSEEAAAHIAEVKRLLAPMPSRSPRRQSG